MVESRLSLAKQNLTMRKHPDRVLLMRCSVVFLVCHLRYCAILWNEMEGLRCI